MRTFSEFFRKCFSHRDIFRILPQFRASHSPFDTVELSTAELIHAEVQLVRALQACDFSKELSHLKHGTARTNLNTNLRLFLDKNGLLRSRGRLRSTLTDESNSPILLPKNEHFCNMVITDMHEKVLHGGVSSTLAKTRERFWLFCGRQCVKKVLRRCTLCKRITGLPYKETPIPDLPAFRVDNFRTFHTVGLDYCGPLYFGTGESGETAKCYICLFTCASTRAMHLELVPKLSTESFIRCLRRFVSRRGIPAIVSDNFSSFKKAFKELNAISLDPKIRKHVADKRIIWNFIVEYSPWQGGFYERLVKEVKDCLKKVLQRSVVNYDELQSLVTEVEAVLNSRPLCYVSNDLETVLTPSHFLVLKRLTSASQPELLATEPNLVKRFKGSQRLLDQLWDIWHRSYLTSLRGQSWNKARSSDIVPKEGHIVLLKDEKPRLKWKIGKIVRLKTGRDGAARSAIVQTMDNKCSTKLVSRPTKLLIPLEICSSVEHF